MSSTSATHHVEDLLRICSSAERKIAITIAEQIDKHFDVMYQLIREIAESIPNADEKQNPEVTMLDFTCRSVREKWIEFKKNVNEKLARIDDIAAKVKLMPPFDFVRQHLPDTSEGEGIS